MNARTKSFPKSTSSKRNKIVALTVMLIVATAGYMLVASRAAGFFASVDPSTAVLAGNASVVTAADGTKALQFNAPATTPPPSGSTTCPLPKYPDETCTGVPAGTVLSSYTGPTTISEPNTVIDSKNIASCLDVTAPGVVIKRSKISCNPGGADVITSGDGAYVGTPLLIEDSTVDCKDSNATAIGDTNFTARRVNISGCENGFDVDQLVTIEDSFIHELYNGGADPHTDGIQLARAHYKIENGQYTKVTVNGKSEFVEIPFSKDVTIRHNTIYNYNRNDHKDGTSTIISNKGSDENVLIQENLLAGGAYALYCDQDIRDDNGNIIKKNTGINYRVVNNHFSTIFHPTVAFYGPATECYDENQSGNVYHESGQALKLE